MKKVKAIHALQFGNRLVEPNTIVDLDAELADAFIASGSAILVQPIEVAVVEDYPEAFSVDEEVDQTPVDAEPIKPLGGKRGR